VISNCKTGLTATRRTSLRKAERHPADPQRHGLLPGVRSQYGNLEDVASGTGVFKLDDAAGTNQPGHKLDGRLQPGRRDFQRRYAGLLNAAHGQELRPERSRGGRVALQSRQRRQMYSSAAGGQTFTRNQFYEHAARWRPTTRAGGPYQHKSVPIG